MAKGPKPRDAGADPAKPRTRKKAPVAPAPAPAGAIPSRTIASPPDNLDALVKRTSWPASQTIHRIHPDEYAPDAFNPGPGGNARFSPIRDAAGNAIPTIYGGTTLECAAMETVFHDVPHAPGLKSVAKRKLRKHHYSRLQPAANLGPKERAYFADRGLATVLDHAAEFVEKRLAPAAALNDGKQTPMRGHPAFIAQHATATCCRTCLAKWHGIPAGRPLSDGERRHVVVAIARWLESGLAQAGDSLVPGTPTRDSSPRE